ncbi:MAG: hypothetical protein WCE38_18775, partial [Burkholderiales bacterium]
LLAAPSASGQVADGTRFTGELMRYLGFDPTKRLPELEKGAVVHNGVPSQEKLAGEIVAATAMPSSACFSTATICSTEKRFLFTATLPSFRFSLPEN